MKMEDALLEGVLRFEVTVLPSGPFDPEGMKVTQFPVVHNNDDFLPWNIHRLDLALMPVLDLTDLPFVNRWLTTNVGSMFSTRDHALSKKINKGSVDCIELDGLTEVKGVIRRMFFCSAGIQSPSTRVFALEDGFKRTFHTVFFVNDIRFDLASHTMVCVAYVMTISPALAGLPGMKRLCDKIRHDKSVDSTPSSDTAVWAWKRLLPALAERCRLWRHGVNCEYKRKGRTPLSEEAFTDPLCSCGRGRDVQGMEQFPEWKRFAPYVTRIAVSPLFTVSYLETVGPDITSHRCWLCGKRGQPKLKACGRCKKVRYCSEICQKKDWKISHKFQCQEV
ncbi:hypothetical protein SCP_0606860 [Sparassis crispa]|uniref:MYND-type domain-containing protein n=1 Tax=Sparassis crispa TaxID=139825 RepID=A0A401GR64_9APHY|nr:hypothetical protein SCP_0606860 [Sparassis crispa]GBE84706.1 hypothetical protein SCP_0606860 [Sparassis crispa]